MKEKVEAKTNEGVWRRRGRSAAWIALVVAGIVVEQFILIGPSLLGRKVLLPLDYLAMPNVYLPSPPYGPQIVPHDRVYSDLVLIEGMSRQFMVSEFRRPLAAMDAQFLLRQPLHPFRVFAFQDRSVLFAVAVRVRLGVVLPGDLHRAGDVFLLPPRPSDRAVAGGDHRLVLAADGVFHLLDGLRSAAIGWLAAVDALGGQRGRAANEPLGRILARGGHRPDDGQRPVRHRRRCCWSRGFTPSGASSTNTACDVSRRGSCRRWR